jgi:hypothetical protein
MDNQLKKHNRMPKAEKEDVKGKKSSREMRKKRGSGGNNDDDEVDSKGDRKSVV